MKGRVVYRAGLLGFCAAMTAAAPLHAQVRPVDAATVDCVYRHAAPTDVATAFYGEGRYRVVASHRVNDMATACEQRFHWPHERTQFALNYASARVLYDLAVRDLSDRRIRPELLERIVTALGERGRAALLLANRSGDDEAHVAAILSGILAAAHISTAPGSPQWASMEEALSQAVYAMMLRDQASAAFGAP